jgi:hypothetical protein
MKKILNFTWESLKELGRGLFTFLAYLALIAAIIFVVSSCQARADKETSRAYLMVLERIDQLEEKVEKLQDDQEEKLDRIEEELGMILNELDEE